MKRLLALGCFISLLICGCSLSLPDEETQERAAEVMESLTEAAEKISEGDILGTAEEEYAQAFDAGEADGASDTGGEADAAAGEGIGMEELPENGYDYSQLSREEQELYAEILAGLQESAADVPVSCGDESVFDKVFQCVMNDHPEIFYVDGYTFIKYTKGDTVTGHAFSGSYMYDREEIAERERKIEEKAEEILAGMPADGGEYEKVKYVYEYLITNTEYVQGAEDNQNICSVFLHGKSVCQGYAKAAQYLFLRMGIASIFVTGKVESGEDHAWNIVRIDGAYYHVDTTWGDASYVMSGPDDGYEGKIPQINYEYLCVPDDQLFVTHSVSDTIPVPACISMAANYYVREGAYFTQADMEKAAALFEKAYEDGTAYVTLKCADAEVYEEMEQHLIERQEVFRFLHTSDGTVAYTTNEGQLALSFWL